MKEYLGARSVEGCQEERDDDISIILSCWGGL